MEVADKTDVVLLCNFPDVCQGHTLVNGNAVCTAACHLTDDSDALPSRPQARCFAGTVDDLPRRLQIGKNILPEIGGLQHRGRCIIDGNDITTDHLGIDTSRDGAHLTRIGEERSCTLGMAEEVGEQGQAPKLVSYGTGTIAYQLRGLRSEEHTSELQSRQYLVCRLLLEKKNKISSNSRSRQ